MTKTSELIGPALDWAVATCEGVPEYILNKPWRASELLEPYSTDWAQGGPIIEREKIEILKGNPLYFPQGNENGDYYEPLFLAGKMHGQTMLIAAMRCYVASKLGNDVIIPEELTK